MRFQEYDRHLKKCLDKSRNVSYTTASLLERSTYVGKVEKWIEAQKAARIASGNPGRVKTNLNIRVDDLRLGIVIELSQEMGMTKRGFAEQLIELALTEAWEKFHGKPLEPADVKRLEGL